MTIGKIGFWIALIAADIIIFFVLSLLLMGYDDNYDPAKGEYLSFRSMNTNEKLISIVYDLFIIANVAATGLLLYKFYQTRCFKMR